MAYGIKMIQVVSCDAINVIRPVGHRQQELGTLALVVREPSLA